jgi:predicted N-acetyltransferase YhbS
MGPRWHRKSSEKLRRGRLPAEGLALVARGDAGTVMGTVRLWEVEFDMDFPPLPGEGGREAAGWGRSAPSASRSLSSGLPKARPGGSAPPPGRGRNTALLLGPLAVDPGAKSSGIGSALMRHAIAEAARLGHGSILLVGDAPYYARFGFSAQKTASLAMPGPYERHRFLALELKDGALKGAKGVLRPSCRTLEKIAPAK